VSVYRRAALGAVLATVASTSWIGLAQTVEADETVAVSGNRYCTEVVVGGTTVRGLDRDYGETWRDVRLRNLDPGRSRYTVGDGTLEVTVTNFTGTSFDWTSNLPLDGVFVNAGTGPAAAHRFYRYAPERSSGSGLTSADATTSPVKAATPGPPSASRSRGIATAPTPWSAVGPCPVSTTSTARVSRGQTCGFGTSTRPGRPTR